VDESGFTQAVNSMIEQFLIETGNDKAIKEYHLESFELNVLIRYRCLRSWLLPIS